MTDKVCIVGAGPSGLVAARALLKAGIPFDWFERHSDVGGIWDQANPGSPMYDTAHFISSKYTSHFYGLPMPESYPDYPTHRQIRDYIRTFADTFGLRPYLTTDTEVLRAEPDGDGWLVTLPGQDVRRYRALIAAVGVTWHPNAPAYPGIDSFKGEIRHTVGYRSPDEFRDKRVLIVGGGNSGVDIACDAAYGAKQAAISLRRGYRFIPKHVFGTPTDVFINHGGQLPDGVTVPEDPSALIDALVGDLTRFGLKAPDHEALTSHPIMNVQLLHHLSHGDIAARPDVASFTERTVIFTDGTEEEYDLVLLATGYDYRIPFLDESLFEWKSGHPQLYLNTFHRGIDSLYVLGFVEFADAAYQRFDEMAALVVGDLRATGEAKAKLRELKASDHPDLRGPMEYIDSPRHANYVETHTFQHVMAQLREDFGWPAPDEEYYADLRHAEADGAARR
jgi:cation diffusion facilitator CzcD-associated flavoprotein CzcO